MNTRSGRRCRCSFSTLSTLFIHGPEHVIYPHTYSARSLLLSCLNSLICLFVDSSILRCVWLICHHPSLNYCSCRQWRSGRACFYYFTTLITSPSSLLFRGIVAHKNSDVLRNGLMMSRGLRARLMWRIGIDGMDSLRRHRRF